MISWVHLSKSFFKNYWTMWWVQLSRDLTITSVLNDDMNSTREFIERWYEFNSPMMNIESSSSSESWAHRSIESLQRSTTSEMKSSRVHHSSESWAHRELSSSIDRFIAEINNSRDEHHCEFITHWWDELMRSTVLSDQQLWDSSFDEMNSSQRSTTLMMNIESWTHEFISSLQRSTSSMNIAEFIIQWWDELLREFNNSERWMFSLVHLSLLSWAHRRVNSSEVRQMLESSTAHSNDHLWDSSFDELISWVHHSSMGWSHHRVI